MKKVAIYFVFALLIFSSASTATDWPTLRGGFNRTAYAPGLSDSLEPRFEMLWNITFEVEGQGLSLSPVISDGIFYSSVSKRNDSYLIALNASNGTYMWNFSTGSDIQSTPTVYEGVIYFGANSSQFYALNATTGTKL